MRLFTVGSSACCATTRRQPCVQWLHDMRVAFEKDHIGWAMWDYQTNFGVVTKTNGVTMPDVDVLNALGLHAPR
jgi:hypothetical protein